MFGQDDIMNTPKKPLLRRNLIIQIFDRATCCFCRISSNVHVRVLRFRFPDDSSLETYILAPAKRLLCTAYRKLLLGIGALHLWG